MGNVKKRIKRLFYITSYIKKKRIFFAHKISPINFPNVALPKVNFAQAKYVGLAIFAWLLLFLLFSTCNKVSGHKTIIFVVKKKKCLKNDEFTSVPNDEEIQRNCSLFWPRLLGDQLILGLEKWSLGFIETIAKK